MKIIIIALLFFGLVSQVYATESTITFTTTEWRQALAKIERDQVETKLLRRQNKDLKQLVTLTGEQYAQCEKLNQTREELGQLDDEYRRQMEAKTEALESTIRTNHWIIGGEAAAILVLLFFAGR